MPLVLILGCASVADGAQALYERPTSVRRPMPPSPTSSPAAPTAPTIWLNSPPTSANDAPMIARLVQRGTGNEQSNRQHYKPKIEA